MGDAPHQLHFVKPHLATFQCVLGPEAGTGSHPARLYLSPQRQPLPQRSRALAAPRGNFAPRASRARPPLLPQRPPGVPKPHLSGGGGGGSPLGARGGGLGQRTAPREPLPAGSAARPAPGGAPGHGAAISDGDVPAARGRHVGRRPRRRRAEAALPRRREEVEERGVSAARAASRTERLPRHTRARAAAGAGGRRLRAAAGRGRRRRPAPCSPPPPWRRDRAARAGARPSRQLPPQGIGTGRRCGRGRRAAERRPTAATARGTARRGARPPRLVAE